MDTRQLIFSALRGRDISLHHNTIGFNRSVEKLEVLGPRVLPMIEDVLNSELSKASPKLTRAAALDAFGLSGVLLIYFRLGARSKHRSAAGFLRQLPPSIREQAVRSIFVLWGPVGASQGVKFPSYLHEPIAELAEAGSSTERSLCRRLLEFLIRKPARANRKEPALVKAS
jgi:hypothetical protein